MRLEVWMLSKGGWRILALMGALSVPLFLLACEEENTYVPPPPPKVTVAQPLIQDITEYLELTGTVEAYAQAEVRARVPGVLESMHFESGTPVNEGDLLFTINPEEYEAHVEAAEAELAQAEARQTETAKTLKRAQTLFEKGNVSQAKLDEAQADFLSAKAGVLVRHADLTRAEINLGYTEVKAPITGRVGRNLVDVGNLVGESEATILTDITTYDPIYVYFEVNERDLLQVMSKNRKEPADSKPAGKKGSLPLELGLANEEGYPRVGITDYADSQVDPDTGTLRVRGVLDNPGQKPDLMPGLFARVRIPFDKSPDMPLVTERAIGFDQSGQYILVVNAENAVEKRNVSLGRILDGLRVITSGVEAGDLVVVNGLQRAREGAEVEAEQIDMATLTASAIEEAADAGEEVQDKATAPSDDLTLSGTPDADAQNEAADSASTESNADAAGKTSADAAAPEPTQD